MLRQVKVRSFYPLSFGVMLVLFSVGCSGSSGTRSVVVMPEQLQLEGVAWTKQVWDEKLDQQLAAYFSTRPQVAENPGLRGQPVCYVNGSTKRIYWVKAVEQSCQWVLLEFKGSRAGPLVEGVGEPFLEIETEGTV
ncbi:hypothetical protein FF011L_52960 [Roseimaritima multifibrata]|uniref:Lipoprotein n=1 Tax=Roseimaritima multifibrata TaxID=1930274 RepID=A0A517MNM7_9BACT|nr:hypothetical protein [Roseimaritima multifibrata]QDS96485.1 hypothetical protein FF011L_52960 [Roseimaritima multifibrata]